MHHSALWHIKVPARRCLDTQEKDERSFFFFLVTVCHKPWETCIHTMKLWLWSVHHNFSGESDIYKTPVMRSQSYLFYFSSNIGVPCALQIPLFFSLRIQSLSSKCSYTGRNQNMLNVNMTSWSMLTLSSYMPFTVWNQVIAPVTNHEKSNNRNVKRH